MHIDDVLNQLQKVKSVRDGEFQACCPAHDDRVPSLSVKVVSGKVLIKCFAGCSFDKIAAALGRKPSEFFEAPVRTGPALPRRSVSRGSRCVTVVVLSAPPAPARPHNLPTKAPSRASRELAATYDYTDQDGNLLYQVVRYEPKAFSQRRPDGQGGWINNIIGVPPVPYNLVAVSNAGIIVVVEGERDVESLRKLGIVATCNSGGAGKWAATHSEYLADKTVRILPDNDRPGLKHARNVQGSLCAKRVKDIQISPYVPVGKDISDWISAGATREQVLEHVERHWLSAADQAFERWAEEMPTGERIFGKLFFQAAYSAGLAGLLHQWNSFKKDCAVFCQSLETIDASLSVSLGEAGNQVCDLWAAAAEESGHAVIEAAFRSAVDAWVNLAVCGLGTATAGTPDSLPQQAEDPMPFPAYSVPREDTQASLPPLGEEEKCSVPNDVNDVFVRRHIIMRRRAAILQAKAPELLERLYQRDAKTWRELAALDRAWRSAWLAVLNGDQRPMLAYLHFRRAIRLWWVRLSRASRQTHNPRAGVLLPRF